MLTRKLANLGVVGYPGIFLVSILSNATVIVPMPGVLLTMIMGSIYDPFWVAVVAGSGAAIGEFTGYLAGYGGQAVIEKKEIYNRLLNGCKNMRISRYLSFQ